jgi:hypothetical protein
MEEKKTEMEGFSERAAGLNFEQTAFVKYFLPSLTFLLENLS